MPASARRRADLWRFAALLLLWELLGRFQLVAHGALPAPSAILVQLWQDRALYPPHLLATLESATAGFAIGNLVAVAAAGLFVQVPAAVYPGWQYAVVTIRTVWPEAYRADCSPRANPGSPPARVEAAANARQAESARIAARRRFSRTAPSVRKSAPAASATSRQAIA